MTHNETKLPQVTGNKSHVKYIVLYMCQICLSIFLTHGVPNTPQVFQMSNFKCDFVAVADLQCGANIHDILLLF
jgi:hypothetical protein